jgi:hypothetical protein
VSEDALLGAIAKVDGVHPSLVKNRAGSSEAAAVEFFAACHPNVPKKIGPKEFPQDLGVKGVFVVVPSTVIGLGGRVRAEGVVG